MNLAIVKSGNNKRLYIQKSYRKNGKSTSKNIMCLGNLNDLMIEKNMSEEEVLAWGRNIALNYSDNEKKKENDSILIRMSSNRIIDKNDNRSFDGGYLFLQSLYYDLRFDNTFRNIRNRNEFEYDIDAIFSDLVYARILNPGSKYNSYEVSKRFIETPKYELHDVYRALSIIAKESDYIQSEMYRNSNLIFKRNNRVLYYDCTNYYFEIEDEDGMKKYGKSKENRPNPIVQMGLFMDGDGIPLAFSIFDGSSNEQKSLIPLEKKLIDDFDFENFVVCTDAGLASKTNKLFNSTLNKAFIVTQSIKKLKKKEQEWIFDDSNWRRLSDNKKVRLEDVKKLIDDKEIYYKEEPYGDKDISNQRLIVTYSPTYARYQKTIRDKQVNRAINMIDKGVSKKYKNENDPSRFISEIKTTDNGEVADKTSLFLNEEKIDEESRYDGLYACTTNLDDSVNEIVKVSKGRWEIEECFRIMKTDFEARPVYLQRDDRIKAHFLICFTALLLIRLLEKKLDNKYTVEDIISTLREHRFLKIDEGYIPLYTRNDITDNLHSVFGFRTDYEIIPPSKMRSIISLTKK